MTAVSSSSVSTVSKVGGWSCHRAAEGLDALDRRRRRPGRGDDEEVLAAVGLARTRRGRPRRSAARAVPSKQKNAFASESSRW